MLENCDKKERWSGVNKLVERWLAERQSLIVQFCALSGVHELSAEAGVVNGARLKHFCEMLVDYVSAGHFEIYYELLSEAESFEDGSAQAAHALIPQLNASTAEALDFNDKYVEKTQIPISGLAKDLSRLGEVLAERFDCEDQLIRTTHSSHSEQVA